MTSLKDLLTKLQIKPKKLDLYEQALTHPSFANENKDTTSYQRLEYFGDALIQKHVSEYIFRRFPNLNEGEMSILRSNVVSGESLAELSRRAGLADFLRLGNNSDALKTNTNVLEDIFEAFCAAIYLDLGPQSLNKFLNQFIFRNVHPGNVEQKQAKNPKTILQEYLQTSNEERIFYKTNKVNDRFEAQFYFGSQVLGRGSGLSKKEAEVEAAKNALKLFSKGKVKSRGEVN